MDGGYRRMRRKELVKLLEKAVEENREKQGRMEELEERLKQREIQVERVGSIAEAALSLNGVFASAQAAAEGYVDALRAASFRADAMEKAAHQRAEAIMQQAQEERERILQEARERADRIHKEALDVRQQVYEQTAREILLRWKECEQGYFSKEQ